MRRTLVMGLALLAATVVGAIYIGSPRLAVASLRDALQSGDRDALERLVDFPSVRENLKSEFSAAMVSRVAADPQLQSNPFSGLAAVFAPMVVDRMIDAAVTPDGLAALIERGRFGERGHDAATTSGPPLKGFQWGFRGDLDTFTVSGPVGVDAPTLVLKRRGFADWKLTRIELPKSFLKAGPSEQAADATPAQPAPSAPPATETPPPAVAESAPVAEPSAASATDPRMEAVETAKRYLAAWSDSSNPDGSAIRPFYAPAVTFYGRTIPLDDLMREKLAFARRWPRRSYLPRPNAFGVECGQDNGCTVTGVLDWRAANDDSSRVASGTASFRMHLTEGLIDQESGRVIARQ